MQPLPKYLTTAFTTGNHNKKAAAILRFFRKDSFEIDFSGGYDEGSFDSGFRLCKEYDCETGDIPATSALPDLNSLLVNELMGIADDVLYSEVGSFASENASCTGEVRFDLKTKEWEVSYQWVEDEDDDEEDDE